MALIVFGLFVITHGQTPAPLVDDPDSYAIYDMLIVRQWPVTVAKASRLVIDLETTDAQWYGGKKLEKLLIAPSPG